MRCPFKTLKRIEIGPFRDGNGSPAVLMNSGAPGTGKTTALLGEVERDVNDPGHVCYGEDQTIFLTSKTNFAVDNARQRFDGLEPATLYKMLWSKFIYQLSKDGVIQVMDGQLRKGRPRYFAKQVAVDDLTTIDEYAKDAASNRPKDESRIVETFQDWDPTLEPKPTALNQELPTQCRFLYSLLLFCEWADREFESLPTPPDNYYTGTVYIDEAQDLCPIEAIAVGWFCVIHSFRIVGYGDPQQAMDRDCQFPKLWEVATECRDIFGEDGKRRVPLNIAELAENVLPGLAPEAHLWADTHKEGSILPLSCAKSAKLPAMRGFNISESRHAVATSVKHAQASKVGLSPECFKEGERESGLVCATVYGVKGYGHDMVTIQLWKPKHRRAYLAGDLRARRRLYVSLTRSEGTVIIHSDMLRMIEEGKDHVWN